MKPSKFPTLDQRMDEFSPPFSSFLRSLYIEVASRSGEAYALGELERLSTTPEEFTTSRAAQAAEVSAALRNLQKQEYDVQQWRNESSQSVFASLPQAAPNDRQRQRRNYDEPLGIIMGLLVAFTVGWIVGLIQAAIQARGGH